MKRQNLIAGLVTVMAVGAWALLVQFGDGPFDAQALRPTPYFDAGGSR